MSAAAQNAMRRLQAESGRLSPAPTAAAGPDRLAHVKQAPPDAILGIKTAFLADKSPKKINLGIGAYRTDDGKPRVLNVVREAERQLAADTSVNREYLPQNGSAAFCKLSQGLVFGGDSRPVREGRMMTVQALSGTGALRLSAEFIKKTYPGATVYMSDVTWGNHPAIFSEAGVKHGKYRYYDPRTRGLNFEGMLADLKAIPSGSIVLMHAVAHNPTGVDPSREQWKQIGQVLVQRGLIPLMDAAYLGFVNNLDDDSWATRYITSLDIVGQMLCQSYAKNAGLYCERAGTFSILCSSAASATAVLSQVKIIIRRMYSNPPAHGARVVERILGQPDLFRQWTVELKEMADRITSMRKLLRAELERLGTPGTWNHVTDQNGMFCFSGLNPDQCDRLTKEFHVYLLRNGRMSMSGVNTKNVGYLARAIDAVVRGK